MARFGRLVGCLFGTAALSLAADASADAVRGTGRVVYYQNGASGGPQLPLVGARVHLMDDDGLIGDDTIRTGFTDANGNFDLSGNADDGWLGGRPDPYIEIELEGSGGSLVVESEILKINVSCATPVRESTAGTIAFGTIACAGDARDGSTLFAGLKRAYDSFRSFSGDTQVPRHGGKAAVLFPATFTAGVPWTTEESIHWPGGYRTFTSVFHEFGHRIRHAQDGDFVHFLADVATYGYAQQHWYTKVTNPGFAFNEGWAAYVSAVNGAESFSSWATVPGGTSVEGNVAANLWRTHQNCGGFARVWSSLKRGGSSIHSWSQFASRLSADVSDDKPFLTKYPKCLASLSAANEPFGDLSTALAQREVHDDAVTLLGALAPTRKDADEPKVSEADQRAILKRLGETAKLAAGKRLHRPLFPTMPDLKKVGEKLAKNRDAFESKEADKLAGYAEKLAPIPQTKEAVDRRRAEHVAFVKDVLKDSIEHVDAQLAELNASKSSLSKKGSKDVSTADQAIERLSKRRDALQAAMKTGQLTRGLLPASFKAAAEELSSSKK